MTNPCEFSDLDCPTPENYAAIAKQLHETALETEERIYCIEHQLRSGTNRPTYVATTTASMGPFPATTANVTFSIFGSGTASTVNFNNHPTIAVDNGGRWTLGPGMWHMGCGIVLSTAGAATDNSYRQITLVRQNNIGGSNVLDRVIQTTYETANSVVYYMTLSAILRVGAFETVQFQFSHGNLASSYSIFSGAVVWFTKISDSDVIRVI